MGNERKVCIHRYIDGDMGGGYWCFISFTDQDGEVVESHDHDLYVAADEDASVPMSGWKVFYGQEPSPTCNKI